MTPKFAIYAIAVCVLGDISITATMRRPPEVKTVEVKCLAACRIELPAHDQELPSDAMRRL
jgi:hypothetical protein